VVSVVHQATVLVVEDTEVATILLLLPMVVLADMVELLLLKLHTVAAMAAAVAVVEATAIPADLAANPGGKLTKDTTHFPFISDLFLPGIG